VALSDDDVREILRLIDESELDELRVETDGFKLHVVRGAGAPAEPEAGVPEPEAAANGATATIAAPMPGTFYRAEGPGMAPFVDVGSQVEPDTVVCIIEIMKMMNSVPAGLAGTIVEVCAEDAQQVPDGAPLFKVRT
jgi:acetyl-CoA carboxylase biotin carboxyl carrier protein